MYHHKTTGCLLLLPLLVFVLPLPASTVYWSSAEWGANVESYSTIGFEEVEPGAYGTPTGITVGDPAVQFVGFTGRASPTNELWVVDPATAPDHDFGSGKVLKGPIQPTSPIAYVEVNLPADVTAIAFELMTVGVSSGEFAIALSTGEEWNNISWPPAEPDQRLFFGVVSDLPIASLQVWQTMGAAWTSYPVYDNFAYGAAGTSGAGGTPDNPGETPEAGTLLLVGSGLILVWRWRRRRPPQFAT